MVSLKQTNQDQFHDAIILIAAIRLIQEKNANYSISWSKSWFGNGRKSPELVDVKDCRETAFIVVHRNQLVLVKDEESKSSLFKHAVLLIFA